MQLAAPSPPLGAHMLLETETSKVWSSSERDGLSVTMLNNFVRDLRHSRTRVPVSQEILSPGNSVTATIFPLVYLTSPEPLKNCRNFLILHPILKPLPPLEPTHHSRSDDILYYTWNLTSKKLAVCPIRKVCQKESTWYLYKQLFFLRKDLGAQVNTNRH